MLDIALLTSNASQLKYILQAGDKHEFYHFMLVLVSISIILQVSQSLFQYITNSNNLLLTPHQLLLAIFSFALSFFPVYGHKRRGKGQTNIQKIRCLDFLLTSFAFLVTVINMVICTFTPSDQEKCESLIANHPQPNHPYTFL